MDIKDILKEDVAQEIIREFGIEGESDEAQAYLIAKLGENILGRVILEIHGILPAARRSEFQALVERGDPVTLEKFIHPFIPNFDMFVRGEAQKEIVRTKDLMKKQAA